MIVVYRVLDAVIVKAATKSIPIIVSAGAVTYCDITDLGRMPACQSRHFLATAEAYGG